MSCADSQVVVGVRIKALFMLIDVSWNDFTRCHATIMEGPNDSVKSSSNACLDCRRRNDSNQPRQQYIHSSRALCMALVVMVMWELCKLFMYR